MEDKFQKAEQDYFALRGKLEAERITREEFEAALKEQLVQDGQGRYWTLGIDSGKWYVHDGKDWVQSDPPTSPGAQAVTSASPTGSTASSRQTKRLAVVAALGCLAIICLASAGGAAYIILNPNTPRPTSVVIAPTSVVTSSPISSAITTPTREQIAEAAPTSTSELTVTPVPRTDTPIPIPTAIPAPAVPPGFYISAMRTNPPKPVRRQDIFFDLRFLNTTGGPRSYRWLVYIYRPDQSRSLGETPSFPFTFPTGAGEIEIGTWRLTGAGGCEDFVARVGWLDDNKRPTLFTKPDGQVFEQPFTVCP